jgi:hypothetical protein
MQARKVLDKIKYPFMMKPKKLETKRTKLLQFNKKHFAKKKKNPYLTLYLMVKNRMLKPRTVCLRSTLLLNTVLGVLTSVKLYCKKVQ